MAPRCSGAVTFFATQADHPVIREHIAAGGHAVVIDQGAIRSLTLGGPIEIARVDEIPLTHGARALFQVENVLAAVGAALALKHSVASIRAGLTTFAGDAEQAPARFNVVEVDGATIIVDYAHNPSAVSALARAVAQFSARRRRIVFSGCNRRDEDLLFMGKEIGGVFDEAILYQDWGHSGRADGELNALLRRGMTDAGRRIATRDVANEREAIEVALADRKPGDLIVLGVESIEQSLALVKSLASIGS
jgi:cyanophycin synthetase